MDRASWLLGTSTLTDPILEIGPSYNPIAAKCKGWRAHVVDHASQAELRAKYAPMGVDVLSIEHVDSVWVGGPLHEALPVDKMGSFSRLIASHVIEHIPDFVAFFDSASRLLAPDGVVALAVPDLRHCFDFFRPLSTTGAVLEAHSLKRSRHSRRSIWDQAAYTVSWHGLGAWGDVAVPDLDFTTSFEAAAQAYSAYDDRPNTDYTDCHAWQFTPARFQLVTLELGQLGILDWRIVSIEGFGAEFLCTLRRGAEQLDRDALQQRRRQLLYLGLAETRQQIDRALGDRNAANTGSDWGALPLLLGLK